jgi:YVTN family beta-propeller protein
MWKLIPLLMPALLLCGCGGGSDEAEVRRLQRRLTNEIKKRRDLEKKLKKHESTITFLQNQLQMFRSASTGTTQPGPKTVTPLEARLKRLVESSRAMMLAMRASGQRADAYGTVIRGEGRKQLVLAFQEAWVKDKNTTARIRQDVLGSRFGVRELAKKQILFSQFELVGHDPLLEIVLMELPEHDPQIQSIELAGDSKMRRLDAAYHVGWATATGKAPREANLGEAFHMGAIAELPEENPDGLMKLNFGGAGLFKRGDPVFSLPADREEPQLIGLVHKVTTVTTAGTTALCLPANRIRESMDRMLAQRRKTIADTFTLEAKVKTMLLTADGKYLAGLSATEDALLIFDAADGKLVEPRRIPVGLSPVDVVECNGRLFVANLLGQTVSVIDLAKLAEKAATIRLPMPQPRRLAAPASGVGDRVYVLAGAEDAQALITLDAENLTIVGKPFMLDTLPPKVATRFKGRDAVIQLGVSASGERLYPVPRHTTPTVPVLDPRGGFAMVGDGKVGGEVLYLPQYGGAVFAAGRQYPSDLGEEGRQFQGFMAAFHRELPYFTTLQSRDQKVKRFTRQSLREYRVDVLNIYAMGAPTKIATVPLPPFRTTWANLAADGRLYLVNHTNGKCVVVQTDKKTVAAKAPTPIINAPQRKVLLGETFSFEPKLLKPKTDADAFVIAAKPNGMTMDEATGKLTWTPSARQIGISQVDLRLRNATGVESQFGFQVNVALISRSIRKGQEVRPLHHFLASPDGKKLYALDPAEHALVILDAATLKTLKQIPVGNKPADCALRGNDLYVLSSGTKTVSIVNVHTEKVTSQFTLAEAHEPFALGVSSGNTLYVGHSGDQMLAVSVSNPSRRQDLVKVRTRDDRGRMSSFSTFRDPFQQLACDERGSLLSVVHAPGRYALYEASTDRLTRNLDPVSIDTASGLAARFPAQCARTVLDGKRRRWMLRNRVYQLRGTTPQIDALKGEVISAVPGGELLFALEGGQREAAGSGPFREVLLHVYDAAKLTLLDTWRVPGMGVFAVLQVDGGLILQTEDTIARLPVDLKALTEPPAGP